MQTTTTPLALRGFLSHSGLCWKFNYQVGAVIVNACAPPSVVTVYEAKRWAATEAGRDLSFTIDQATAHGFTYTAAG